jgi:hypothetical protein
MAILTIDGSRVAYAQDNIAVDSTAGGLGLTAANLNPTGSGLARDLGKCREAIITVIGYAVRVTLDGTAPVAATTGIYLAAGDVLVLRGYANLLAFRAIRDTGSSASISVTYLR